MLERAIRWMIYGLPWAAMLYRVRFRFGPLPTTLLEVYALLLIGLWAVNVIRQRRAGVRMVGCLTWQWIVLLLAWFAVTLSEVCVSPSVWTGFGLWRAYVLEPMLVFVVVLTTLKQDHEWSMLRWSMFFTIPFLAIWSMVQFFTGWGIPHPWNVAIEAGRRAVGVFGFPNGLALFVTPIGAWASALLLHSYFGPGSQSLRVITRTRLLLGGIFLSTLLCLVLSKSDGGIIGLGASMFVVLMLWRKTRWWTISLVVLGTAFAFGVPEIRQVLIKELTFQGWSGRVRVWMWQDTWRMLKDHWLLGAGFGGYPKVYAAYHSKSFIEIFQYPHTILFTFWSETGLIGLGVFVGIVLQWAGVCMQRFRQSRFVEDFSTVALIAPLMALLVHGLVDVPYFKNDLALIFFLFLAFLLRPKEVGMHRGVPKSV